MGPADTTPGPLAKAPIETVAAAVLGNSRRPAGTGRGLLSRESPCLPVASGGKIKSLGRGPWTTDRPLEKGPRARSLGPVPLDWAETQDHQCHLPTAPPTGEAHLPQVGWGIRDPGPRAEPFGAKTLRSAGPPSIPNLESSKQPRLEGLATIILQMGKLRLWRYETCLGSGNRWMVVPRLSSRSCRYSPGPV